MRNALTLLLALGVGCSDYNVGTDEGTNTGTDDDDTGIIVDPGAPDILVEPMTLSFGTRPVDCAADTQTVTVTNVGEDLLEVYSLDLMGAGAGQYTVTGAPINLASGESFTFDVDFVPSAMTNFQGRVQITSNDPDEGEVDVSLDGSGGENATNADTFDQGYPEAVDVLWVLDNSCSMSDEITAVEQGLDAFIANFVTMGLDYQMGVVTTDMDDAAQSGRLQGPTKVMASATMSQAEIITAFDAAVDPNSAGSGTERPMAAAEASLTNNSAGFALGEGLIRSNAHLSVIVITDEDDSSSGNVQHYVDLINGMKPSESMSNVSGLIDQAESLFSTNCPGGIGFDKLKDIIDQTGGLRDGICELVDPNTGNADPATVDQLLQWLSFTAAGLETSFELSDVPTSRAQIRVTVNGVQVPPDFTDGWYWDEATNTVTFYGDSVPGSGDQVVITYPVAAEC